jgi:hypothetical protein
MKTANLNTLESQLVAKLLERVLYVGERGGGTCPVPSLFNHEAEALRNALRKMK